ncbi:hypothetical protein OG417_48575 [Actinoallomurus sp. NBC_01490]|uniref:hypothetical protein n=1 Tax=Actinoallomurus sp. NBC_01490 TaxID=2903557 RepID=UPI002E32C838|nr:hypothetical protein [Actinoallomurus sp. NBC_01490]
MEANPVDAAVFDRALAVADAVLYEGYLLYPYRHSSAKNRFRWQFGVLTPRAWAEARDTADAGVAGSAEGWWQRTECLLEPGPGEAVVRCRLRFLQLVGRSIEERLPDGGHRPTGELVTGSGLAVGFDAALPRDFDLCVRLADVLDHEQRVDLHAPGGKDVETLGDDEGRPVGRALSRRWPVRASLIVSATRCSTPAPLFRLCVRVENTDDTTPPDAPREEALRRSLIATHSLLAAGESSFVSLLEPPGWAEAEARACANVHTFPVLAGEPGTRDLLLSSPILLYDHPRIAPESPGDLHDAAEIDEILSLRTLTLTDEEKREARATDPRGAAIVDRVDTMPPEIFSRLHGAIRSLGPASPNEESR